MLSCSPLEPGPSTLKRACQTVKYQNTAVCLRSPRDHVRNEIPVARGIEDCKVAVRGREELGCHLDGHTTSLFFFCFIHDVSELKPSLAVVFGRLLMLTQLCVAHMAELVQQVASESALATVNVANHDDV